jgi:hypothetical protein
MRSGRNGHGLTWQNHRALPRWFRCRERACFRKSQGVRTRVRTWSPEPCAQVRILLTTSACARFAPHRALTTQRPDQTRRSTADKQYRITPRDRAGWCPGYRPNASKNVPRADTDGECSIARPARTQSLEATHNSERSTPQCTAAPERETRRQDRLPHPDRARDGRLRRVKDFDVWSFYAELDGWPFPPRWRGTRDFGPSKFGRYPGDPARYSGRRVDCLGRSLPAALGADPAEAIRRYLAGRRTESARQLAAKAVILIDQRGRTGEIVWPAGARGPAGASSRRRRDSTSGFDPPIRARRFGPRRQDGDQPAGARPAVRVVAVDVFRRGARPRTA